MTDSYERLVLTYSAAMLAACQTWAALCNESAPARTKIIMIDAGDEAVTGSSHIYNIDGEEVESVSPLAMISLESMTEEIIGVAVFRRSGTVKIGLRFMPPEGYHPAQACLWATDIISDIKSELRAQYGTTGKLAKGTVRSDQMMILDSSSSEPGAFQTIISLEWRA